MTSRENLSLFGRQGMMTGATAEGVRAFEKKRMEVYSNGPLDTNELNLEEIETPAPIRMNYPEPKEG